MALTDACLALRHLHLGAVALSLSLFAARGAAVLAGAAWPMAPWARRASVLIDSVLLAGGAGLWWLLGLNPLRDAWLGTKLLLLLAYIVLGSFALKRAPSRRARGWCFVAALACVGWLVSVALAHHPAGAWRLLITP
ncbi:hypothetical protein BurJ1DRAFT_0683 [Burkholderiales bacterium JOSHI_001]|nr:hypothetical protein BurJ1DRAFT_0683 [Burkholderiales bacterium JOSHI_001]